MRNGKLHITGKEVSWENQALDSTLRLQCFFNTDTDWCTRLGVDLGAGVGVSSVAITTIKAHTSLC